MHRDVKGDNLVIDEGGHVILTDFGFAKKITIESESDSESETDSNMNNDK